MKLRLSPRALADAKRLKTWWRQHRTKAPDLFERELDDVLAKIVATPTLGVPFWSSAWPNTPQCQ